SLLAKQDFFSLSPAAFDALAIDWGWPKFRADQVRDWVYKKGVLDPNLMTNLAKRDREQLMNSLTFGTSEVVARQHSTDGTIKLLLRWLLSTSPGHSTAEAETVMIPDGQRYTA